MSKWQGIETAPKDGTPILAECEADGVTYLASVSYWSVEALTAASNGGSWTVDEEYWSLTEADWCCKPVRWLPDFDMPNGVKVHS